MEFIKEFLPVPTLVVICLFLSEGVKIFMKEEKYHKFLPVISGLIGGILSLFSFCFFKGFIPAENVLTALAIGIVSGWAATGVHQSYKQLGR